MPRFRRNRRLLIAGISITLLAFVTGCGGGNGDPDSPAPTATPLAGDRAPTAQVPIPPTPDLNATPTSTLAPSPTPVPQASTVTPISPTPTQLSAPGTPTPAETATPTVPSLPTSTPVVIEVGQELVNEPQGVLQLQPGAGRAIQYQPGVEAANFRVNVAFANPFHPDFSAWDYGIKFRDDGNTYQMFVFDHRQNLLYIKGTGSELEIVDTVSVPDLLTTGGSRNDFNFLIVEDRASVFLDGLLLKTYSLDDVGISGEISLVTDIYNQTTVVGAQTQFFDLSINSGGLIGRVASGRIIRSGPDQVAVGEFTLPTSAGYARVTLISPLSAFSGDYSFGLLFRTESTGIDNWLVFDDRKQWQHIRRSTTGAEVVFTNGFAEALNTREGGENLLEFLSTGRENQVYLNGELLMNMSLLAEDLPFTLAPMAGFEPEHQLGSGGTEYRDFAAWSVAQ